MQEMQLWQSEYLGEDKDTLKKVLRIFRSDGVQGIESQKALENYVKRLSNYALREMYEMDEEAALQMLVDSIGVLGAFHKYALLADCISMSTKEISDAGWISQEDYAEVTAKYEERTKKLNEEKDQILSDYTRAAQKAEDAEEKIFSLRDELAHCKSDLYDFYAQAGRVPNYER